MDDRACSISRPVQLTILKDGGDQRHERLLQNTEQEMPAPLNVLMLSPHRR